MSETPVYHLQNTTTLELTVDGTQFPLAGVQEATITLTQNIVELFTGDQTTRDAKYAEEKVPELTLTVSRWNHELLEDAILDGGSIDDSSEIRPLSLSGTFEAGEPDSDREVSLEIVGLTTEEWPIFALDTGDYGEWSMDMRGDDFTQFDIVDA